jgi:putative ABC transport system permease protein
MIGIGLVGVVAIVAASMKASARDGVQRSLRADLVVAASGTPGSSGGVPNTVADVLRRTPAVAEVSEIRGGQWGLNGSTQTVLAVDPATVSHTRQIDRASAGPITELDDHSVLVRDTVAEHHGWTVGDEVPMTFARTGTQQLRVMGLFSATAVRTDYVISLAAYRANFAQQLDLDIDVKLHPGVSLAQGRADIEGALRDFPVATVMDRSQVLAAQQKQVDRLLVPVTALLALSVVIALLGIANTLALSILERIHELGMLRAIGMARAQVRSMIRSEAVIIASLGSSLGVAIAVFFGWALVSALHNVGVTTLVLPVRQLGGLVAAATVAGLLAGVLPARRAARMSVLVAVGSDR